MYFIGDPFRSKLVSFVWPYPHLVRNGEAALILYFHAGIHVGILTA